MEEKETRVVEGRLYGGGGEKTTVGEIEKEWTSKHVAAGWRDCPLPENHRLGHNQFHLRDLEPHPGGLRRTHGG